MRPTFIPKPQILSKIYYKCHIIFQNCSAFKQILEILVSDWWNCVYFCVNLRKFWKYDPFLYQFLHWIGDHRYTRRLILRPISAARPQIDLCTKNPPPPDVSLMAKIKRVKWTPFKLVLRNSMMWAWGSLRWTENMVPLVARDWWRVGKPWTMIKIAHGCLFNEIMVIYYFFHSKSLYHGKDRKHKLAPGGEKVFSFTENY